MQGYDVGFSVVSVAPVGVAPGSLFLNPRTAFMKEDFPLPAFPQTAMFRPPSR